MNPDSTQLTLIANKFGETFFTFNSKVLESNLISLKSAFNEFYKNTTIAYSYKTNYTPYVITIIKNFGGLAEVVSGMEYQIAKSIGVESGQIIFNGPAKSVGELKTAIIEGALINIDSLQELKTIVKIIESGVNLDAPFRIGIRCNIYMGAEVNSRFGVASDSSEFNEILEIIRANKKLKLAGLHCHLPNRTIESVENRVEALSRIALETFDSAPEFLNIGGGFFGISQPEKNDSNHKPSFLDYARVISQTISKVFQHNSWSPNLIIEPGTALIADCFTYWTRVVSTKKIGKLNYAAVDGSLLEMNPNNRSSRFPAFHIPVSERKLNSDRWNIGGYTCIENDFLTENYDKDINVGDYLGYSHVGSYSVVMKPPFIRPACPILEVNDSFEVISVVREQQKIKSIFAEYR